MNYDHNDLKRAFELYTKLIQNKKITKRDLDDYYDLQKHEIKEIFMNIIEPVSEVKTITTSDSVYIVPTLDNEVLSYKNEELREILKLENNKELYLSYFIMLVIVSVFYNTDSQLDVSRQSISIEDLRDTIKQYIERIAILDENKKQELLFDGELDIDSIIDVWNKLKPFDEQVVSIENTKKNQIGFIWNILRFLQKEELIFILEKREITITEKTNDIISGYYFNSNIKEKIAQLFTKNGGGTDA